MISAYRLVDPLFADDPFSGVGARDNSGRWNTSGHRVVYTSQSVALATLELLANIPGPRRLPEYMLVDCLLPEAIVEEFDRSLLPANWTDVPSPAILQELGNEWLISRSSAVLAVPSAVVPSELNYLLNPEHGDFASIEIGSPRPFRLDFRLMT